MNSSQLIWSDEFGRGQNIFVLFLCRFTIEEIPGSCPFNIFADSLYRLRVNGQVIGFGPARFLPSHPQYDSYNLAPWLRAGSNTVLVEVNSRGAACFQAVISRGAFIASGKAGSIDFSTPGQWLVCPTKAWRGAAEPFSFAQGPVEMLQLSDLPFGYPGFEDRFDSAAWRRPVLVAEPEHWGPLTPRTIPMPSLDPLVPQKVLVAAPVKNGYLRTGFNPGNQEVRVRQPFFLHVFSPVEQVVDLGVFWGPLFLNGVELVHKECTLRGNRQNARAHLRAGWNFIYGRPELLRANWTWLMELPDSVGLKVRALPLHDCKNAFGLGQLSPSKEIKSPPASLADLSDYPADWRLVGWDLNGCSPARELAWDLIDQGWIRHFEQGVELPSKGEACTIVFDLGREYLGHLAIDFETENGGTLDVGYDERTNADGALAYFQCNPFVNSADRFVFEKGRQEVIAFHERGGRYLQLSFRRRPGRVIIHHLHVIQTSADLALSGDVYTNEASFNWIWQTGVKTIQACTADGWVDCPWRERGMYLGDVLVMSRAARKFTGDWRLEPWAIRLWAQGQFENGQLPDVVPSAHEIPFGDYSLIWIEILRNYWAATGDLALVAEVWPTLQRILGSSVWQADATGLWKVHEGCGVFVDWGATDEEKSGTNGALNAFRIRALDCAEELSGALGWRAEQERFTAEAAAVRKAFQRHFWDPRSGRFAASLTEGQLSPGPSYHVNALTLAYDLADESQVAGALAYLKAGLAQNTKLGPGRLELYFFHFVLEGLYRVNESGLAEKVMQEHYGFMQKRGAWTFWETLKSGLTNHDSLCHGWSAAPVTFFSERILGVRELIAGNPSQILVAPEADSLRFASGSVPHPRGRIRVAWRIDGQDLLLSVQTPADVIPHIQPAGRLAGLRLKLIDEAEIADNIPLELSLP
jgi:hypothetical protein